MLPACLTTSAQLERKKEAFARMRTGDHRADVEHWHDGGEEEEEEEEEDEEEEEKEAAEMKKMKEKKRKMKKVKKKTKRWRPFFESPPKLTLRQEELYGLRPYCTTSKTEDSSETLQGRLVQLGSDQRLGNA